jgi:Fe-S-cluster containining protein
MNNIIKENSKNRRLFRELFFSSQKNLKSRFDSLKKNFSCNRCHSCCQNRYLEISPEEMQSLAKNEPLWAKFLDFFELVSDENDFVQNVKNKTTEPVWFYSCRYFDGQKCNYEGAKEPFCLSCGINFEKVLPTQCSYTGWQKAILKDIEDEIFKDVLIKYKQMEAYKENFSCNRTGTCCKFACSEFSYDELRQKASNNDNFAKQFVSVFQPYEDQEKARKIYPEYVDMLKQKLGPDENVYFYFCSHLDKNDLCTQYDKRPDICRDFPNNPLSILPPWCGYYEWKEEVEVLAMTLHALVNLGEFYKEKLEQVI